MAITESPLPGANHHLEAYKLLADMYKQEESVFWPRNQTFLLLNSGLIAILVGILGLQSKKAPPTTSPLPATTQTVPAVPTGAPSPITIQQIVNQPVTPSAESGPTLLRLPLFSISVMGIALCCVWAMLIKRAQGTNDHLAMHMKCLEKHRLKEITNMTTYDKLFATEREKSRRRWPKCLPDTMEVNELTTEDANGKPETPRLPRLGSIMRVYDAWVAIAAFFVVLWAVMGGWILFTLW